ncbi:hypothetical protein EDD22DRAFT_347554 [Suillus occidentalis]|nr:hypothetical protein EDD22DRAFT_347554 [Suillus occidentalis]
MMIENQHTYSLINFQGGTAVTDLSIVDNYSTVGYRPYNVSDFKSNQAWTFQQDGDQHEWFIKSSCSGKYLGVEGKPNQGTVVVVVSNPFKWNIIDSDMEHAKGIRILAHGTNLSLDLWCGSPENFIKIQLWESWPGNMQIWALTALPKDDPKEPLKITIPAAARDALIKGDLSTADTVTHTRDQH